MVKKMRTVTVRVRTEWEQARRTFWGKGTVLNLDRVLGYTDM